VQHVPPVPGGRPCLRAYDGDRLRCEIELPPDSLPRS
jgi:hypothetical protein